MAPLVSTIADTRPDDKVFAQVTDPSCFGEWQHGVVSGHMDGAGPTAVGSRCITTRRIGFGERPSTSEVTRMQPPPRWAVHGVDGPIRPVARHHRAGLRGARDREGLVPLAVRQQARREMPGNLRALKERLERGG